jgi:hypothetical protein
LTVSDKIRKLLESIPDVKPKKASELLKITYNDSFRQIFYSVKKSKKIVKTVKKNQAHHSSKIDDTKFIDDPDELLMSVAVRELNKPNPDPRWANVLITTRKENIGQSTKEGKIRSKFKSMNIKDIAKISSGKPTDISQKPDLEESS